jgi:hypothetical protein
MDFFYRKTHFLPIEQKTKKQRRNPAQCGFPGMCKMCYTNKKQQHSYCFLHASGRFVPGRLRP